jgi:two-component system, NtrC family, sensor kinase
MAPLPISMWRTVLDASASPTVVGDAVTGRVEYANPAARALFGYSAAQFTEFTGRTLHPSDDLTTIDAISDALDAEGHAFVPSTRLQTRDYRTCWAQVHVSRVHHVDRPFWVATYQDITEQVERSRQLERLSQLTTVGRLAAGVAHEVNNPATFVLANLDSLRVALDGHADADVHDMLEESMEGVKRIAKVAQQLKGLAHDELDTEGTIDFDSALDEAARLTRTLVERRGRLLVEHGSVGTGPGDHPRLVSALVNLLLNAADAIEPGGLVRLRCRRRGSRAQILVSDNGSGMAPEVQKRALEPFFSTRPAGRGSGLGLSVTWRIITDLGGSLLLSSAPNEGTTVTVDLPLVRAEKPAPAPVVPRLKRLLVVDDEEHLLRAVRRMLSGHFEVELASSGADALRMVEGMDLILLDLVMPHMDGIAVYEALTEDQKKRVLFMSGGALDARGRTFLKSHRTLPKPFGTATLLGALRQAADRVTSSG